MLLLVELMSQQSLLPLLEAFQGFLVALHHHQELQHWIYLMAPRSCELELG